MLKNDVFHRIKVYLIGIIEFFVAILHRRREIKMSTTRKMTTQVQNTTRKTSEIMKRFILLFVLALVTLTSCENVQDNQTSVQATVDNTAFNALYATSDVNQDGSVDIQTSSDSRVITIHLDNTTSDSFVLGGTSEHYATFTDVHGNTYTTQGSGSGRVEITDRCVPCGTINGRFDFSAVLPGIDVVEVSNGMFVDIVIGGPEVEDDNRNKFEAQIDTANFNPVVVNTINTGNFLLIEGQKGSTSLIVRVPITVQQGDYNLVSGGFNATMVEGLITQDANSGSITILSHNSDQKTMTGTFDFQVGSTQISQGVFEVKY